MGLESPLELVLQVLDMPRSAVKAFVQFCKTLIFYEKKRSRRGALAELAWEEVYAPQDLARRARPLGRDLVAHGRACAVGRRPALEGVEDRGRLGGRQATLRDQAEDPIQGVIRHRTARPSDPGRVGRRVDRVRVDRDRRHREPRTAAGLRHVDLAPLEGPQDAQPSRVVGRRDRAVLGRGRGGHRDRLVGCGRGSGGAGGAGAAGAAVRPVRRRRAPGAGRRRHRRGPDDPQVTGHRAERQRRAARPDRERAVAAAALDAVADVRAQVAGQRRHLDPHVAGGRGARRR